ncbi:hypothetical protein [Nocardioides abyssi]|uniref:Nucleotide exchange factor GrpE n=1 Tax=Nocardioides abyssi TaxID=3058370 RepID=A0ABT8EU90_9ACTN|nr:hypothetical protein [Nocardioides abyssi]MDN4161672.1 hypothetical protein [Nocardioides abyssi]
MSQEHQHDETDQTRIDRRAELLPEEETAGSADPEAQAEAILEESDERTQDPEGTQEASEQTGPRTSEQASHTPTGA